MIAVFALASAVVALDQVSKVLILDRLPLGVPVALVDDLLSFTLVMNPGLAFGLLGSVPRGWRWVVAALSLVALARLQRRRLGHHHRRRVPRPSPHRRPRARRDLGRVTSRMLLA